MVNALRQASQSSTPVALNELFFRLTLDTFVKMAFGIDINSLKENKSVPFAVAFDFAQNQMNWRFLHFHWRISEYFMPQGWRMKREKKVIDDFAYGIIDERSNSVRKEGESKDLLSLYLAMKDENGVVLPREQVKDAVINLIIAGRDTTAQALSWCFFYLIKNPRSISSLRKEIVEKLGEEKVHFDNYKSLHYANAVLHEALRLQPPVPKSLKLALEDDQIPGGPKVKAGEYVRWSDWQMARDSEVWGEDCAEFNPGRFLDENGVFKRIDQWKFHVFNGGPRLCLGQSMATFEAVSTIVALVRNFDFEFEKGWWENVEKTQGMGWEEETPLYASSMTLPMKHPMMVVPKILSQ